MSTRHERGVLDTSVVVDLDLLPEEKLPLQSAIAAVTLAELSAGLHTTSDAVERGARLARLQFVEANLDSLPFDAAAARRYGQLIALIVAAGQSPRPRRLDLMIAATALVNDLPLYTRNARDFSAIEAAVTIVAV
ncbi:MAG: type II toxin-antitoxin system VapC family toxin [Deltaproteobacteria bacterium]